MSDRLTLLVVGNNFCGYDEAIATELRRRNTPCQRIQYQGYLPSDKKFNSALKSTLFFYLVALLSFHQRVLFTLKLRRQLKATRFDSLLVVNGSFLIPQLLPSRQLRRGIIWIMDPVFRFPHAIRVFRYFGVRYSYDSRDLHSLDAELLPLFADPYVYASRKDSGEKERYLFAFVGALHICRLQFLEKACEIANKLDLEVYFGGVFGQLSECLKEFDRGSFPLLRRLLVIRSHTHEEISSIYSMSEIIINIHAQNHSGPSMRTFEALALGKVQVTDAYNPTDFPFSSAPEAFIYVKTPEDICEQLIQDARSRTIDQKKSSELASLANRINVISKAVEKLTS